jgi:predicted dithiol-disulfide oxidoreductase (DUF899 family)
MNRPQVVSEQEWQTARDALLVKEKEYTRALDALAAERRRLPMVKLDPAKYTFTAPDGSAAEIEALRARFGWSVRWYSSYGTSFNDDMGLTSFGLSVRLRDGDEVFRGYFTTARGVDRLRLDFNLLDLTPYGRQEQWEDSPEGWPQDPTMSWLRPHDEY